MYKFARFLALFVSFLIALSAVGFSSFAESNLSANDIYADVTEYMLSLSSPQYSYIGGEWMVIGLACANEMTDQFTADYIKSVKTALDNTGSSALDSRRTTENSRVIIALTSLGYDASDFYGYNLLEPLKSLDKINAQGVNGAIYALIALDTYNYDIPVSDGAQTTKDELISAIISEQDENGAFTYDGETADADLTAMAITALSKYYNADYPAVLTAVNKALDALSDIQNDIGGFTAYGSDSSESCAQAVVALTSLGIDPNTDERFIKNDISVLSAMLSFYEGGGQFSHDGTEPNAYATEQCYYALVSYMRYLGGETALFDMSDYDALEPLYAYDTNDNAGADNQSADSEETTANSDVAENTTNSQNSDTSSDYTDDDDVNTGAAAPVAAAAILLAAVSAAVISRKKR